MRILVERTTAKDDDGNETVDYIIADHLRPHVQRYVTDGDATYAELDAIAVAMDSSDSISAEAAATGVDYEYRIEAVGDNGTRTSSVWT